MKGKETASRPFLYRLVGAVGAFAGGIVVAVLFYGPFNIPLYIWFLLISMSLTAVFGGPKKKQKPDEHPREQTERVPQFLQKSEE